MHTKKQPEIFFFLNTFRHLYAFLTSSGEMTVKEVHTVQLRVQLAEVGRDGGDEDLHGGIG